MLYCYFVIFARPIRLIFCNCQDKDCTKDNFMKFSREVGNWIEKIQQWRQLSRKKKLKNNIFLSIVRLEYNWMIEYNFRPEPLYYIWSKLYNLVKMVFSRLIFRLLSLHMHIIINNVLDTYNITYTPREVKLKNKNKTWIYTAPIFTSISHE